MDKAELAFRVATKNLLPKESAEAIVHTVLWTIVDTHTADETFTPANFGALSGKLSLAGLGHGIRMGETVTIVASACFATPQSTHYSWSYPYQGRPPARSALPYCIPIAGLTSSTQVP